MFTPATILATTLSILLLAGTPVQAALPLDQIVGGLNNFRDMARQLQPAASGMSASPVAALWGSNRQGLQQCASGWAQALRLGGGFVNAIGGTPVLSDDDRGYAASIANAYADCAQSHTLLMQTMSNAASGTGYGTPLGASLAQTMNGISAVISGLTVDLVGIVGEGSDAAQSLHANQAHLLNCAARVQACYGPVTGVAQCTLLGLQGY